MIHFFRRLRFAALLSLGLVLMVAPAAAHIMMDEPLPLTDDDDAKLNPCGCYFGAEPNEPEDSSPSPCPADYPIESFRAGQITLVTFRETINHPGSFRIAFSPNPPEAATPEDFDANVLYDEVDENSESGGIIDAQIEIPDAPCALCTLQLRQTMTDDPRSPHYFNCAAIVIEGDAGDGDADADADADADGDGDADADADADTDTDADGGSSDDGACGCGVASRSPAGIALLCTLLVTLLRRRRS